LQNILGGLRDVWTLEERQALIAGFEQNPLTALAMLRFAAPEELPAPGQLLAMFQKVGKDQPRANEFKAALVEAIGKSRSPEVAVVLRKLADADSSQNLTVARALQRFPAAENLPYLLRGVAAASPQTINELLDALKKSPGKPKPDDPTAFRIVLQSAAKLQPPQKWKVIELLRSWTGGKSFGADKKEEWKSELSSWGRWYAQTFPKEPRLPDIASEQPAESKYKFADLAAYLEKDPKGSKGDPLNGKLIFTKANCIKCHKFGTEGEGIGPDLTMLAKRFKRSEILESILEPSKVISDQYRSSTISTLDGRTFIGLAAEQGGMITILLQDASKIVIKSSDVESRFASLVSVMPEKLLDELTKEEIADLFAFLDSAPPEKK
jgi:putative heme-binding domain-containing protein